MRPFRIEDRDARERVAAPGPGLDRQPDLGLAQLGCERGEVRQVGLPAAFGRWPFAKDLAERDLIREAFAEQAADGAPGRDLDDAPRAPPRWLPGRLSSLGPRPDRR